MAPFFLEIPTPLLDSGEEGSPGERKTKNCGGREKEKMDDSGMITKEAGVQDRQREKPKAGDSKQRREEEKLL